MALALALLGAAGYLTAQASRLWFFGDDWDFLLQRSLTGGGGHGVWAPHNEHWSTLPIVTYRVMFQVFGLGHYLAYALLPIVLHVIIVVLVWLLMVRCGLRPWIATSVGVVLAVMGVGAEDTLWDFQIGFLGPIAFGLLALLLLPAAPGRWRRDGAVLVLVLCGLMTSGQGLVMLVVVSLYATLVRGVRFAGLIAGFGLGAYAVWWAAIGHTGMRSSSITASTVAGVPVVVLEGLAHVGDGLTGLPGAGAVLLIGVVVALLRTAGADPAWQRSADLSAACLAGAVTLLVLTGLTRVQSMDQAGESRYAYIAAVLMAPGAGLALQLVLGGQPVARRLTQGMALVLVTAMVLTGLAGVDRFRVGREHNIGALERQLRGTVALTRSGALLLADQPSVYFNPQATVATLLAADRAGHGVDGHAGSQDLLEAAAVLQVQVGREVPGAPAATGLVVRGARLAAADQSGCAVGRATAAGSFVELPTAGLMQLRFRTSVSKVLTRVMRDGLSSTTATWRLRPGTDTFLSSTVPAGGRLQLAFGRPADFVVCAG